MGLQTLRFKGSNTFFSYKKSETLCFKGALWKTITKNKKKKNWTRNIFPEGGPEGDIVLYILLFSVFLGGFS